jgi:UDP-arabinose 4-epimerase
MTTEPELGKGRLHERAIPPGTRVLVTGGAGYIGSHTAKLLAQMGCEPVVFDNLSTGHSWAVKWGPLVRGDLENSALLRSTLAQYRIQAVIHFAASAYVGESMRKPRQYFQNNVVNSLNLLDVLVDAGIQHIVFSSTCATYGMANTVPISEDHPQVPVNPYGESKRFLERALYWHGEAYDLRWVALRYFNAAGADLEGEIGEMHSPETHLIPLAMEAASGSRPSLEVYGTDYPTPDGTAIRDYIHVTDLAAAHVLALKYLLDGNKSVALNLGTGKGHSVREVVAEVGRVSGQRIKIRAAERRPGDPPILVADPRRASELLDWQPRHSGLDKIVESAWSWHKAQSERTGAREHLIAFEEALLNADWERTVGVINRPTAPRSAKWL